MNDRMKIVERMRLAHEAAVKVEAIARAAEVRADQEVVLARHKRQVAERAWAEYEQLEKQLQEA